MPQAYQQPQMPQMQMPQMPQMDMMQMQAQQMQMPQMQMPQMQMPQMQMPQMQIPPTQMSQMDPFQSFNTQQMQPAMAPAYDVRSNPMQQSFVNMGAPATQTTQAPAADAGKLYTATKKA